MALENSYDSKINKSIRVNEILFQINKAALRGERKGVGKDIIFIVEDMDVLPFQHPIYDKDNSVVYLDTRPYTSLERNGELRVRNDLDNDLSLIRGKLELAWMRSQRRDEIETALKYSSEIFCRWLSDLIIHNYGLGIHQQMKILALTGIYNVGQFENSITDSRTGQRHCQQISRMLPVSVETVIEVAETLEWSFPRDIDEFVDAIHKLDLGPRMRDFSATALYSMLGGSWYGNANTLPILGLALEYPPAFAALVKMAVDNNMYRRSIIGQKVDKFKRNNAHENFKHAINRLIDRYVDED